MRGNERSPPTDPLAERTECNQSDSTACGLNDAIGELSLCGCVGVFITFGKILGQLLSGDRHGPERCQSDGGQQYAGDGTASPPRVAEQLSQASRSRGLGRLVFGL